MATTYSTNLRINLPATGELAGTWGTITNTNLGTLLEQSISGTAAVTHDDAANYTLTALNGVTDEARQAVINIGGALSAARNAVVPTVSKLYVAENSTTGGFSVVVKTSAGTGITIPNGLTAPLRCDGTDILAMFDWMPSLSLSALTLSEIADTATAATHYYVEIATDGLVRPKTLANVKTEIVTTAAVNTAAATVVGTITSGVWNGTDIAVADGGTGRSTSTTAYGLLAAGTTATGVHQTLAAGATTEILVGGGASALPVWTTAQGSGAPVRATSPTLVTPVLGAASATSLTITTGPLLIGTPTEFDTSCDLQILGNGAFAPQMGIRSITADTTASYFKFSKEHGSNVAVITGDGLGTINFYGLDAVSGTMRESVRITASAEGTVGAGWVPGRLSFQTALPSGVITENMRVSSSGIVEIGIFSGGDYRFRVYKGFGHLAATTSTAYFDGQTTQTTTQGTALFRAVMASPTVSQVGFTNTLNIASGGAVVGVYSTPAVSGTGQITGMTGVYSQTRSLANCVVVDMAAYQTSFVNSGGGTVTNTYGYKAPNTTVGTNNYGYYGEIAAASNAWNLYMTGTAANYLEGTLQIGRSGTIPADTYAFIDRLGTGTIPALTAGTVLTLAGASAAGSPAYLQIISGNATVAGIFFGDTDSATDGRVQYDHTDRNLEIFTAGAQRVTIDSTGLYVGASTSNVNQLVGVTINEGAGFGSLLTLKNSGVSTGFTTLAEADTCGEIWTGNTYGGIWIGGYAGTGQYNSMAIQGYITDTQSTRSTAASAPVHITASAKSGTAGTAMPADTNLVCIKDHNTVRFILDSDGDSHQDVGTAWTNFDHMDDIAALDALSYNVARADDPIKRKFGEWMLDKRDALERNKIVTFNDDGHHFVNMSKLTMLNTGAIRQIGEGLNDHTRQIKELVAENKSLHAQMQLLENRA